ncbi:MAG TPA: ribonuclease H family protein [Anaerolineales bacterium]|nr:ribonuclease H family protein [Anaerolineales bacterium]HNS59368.1 ribonuclease H family protein [Anaerolineales bacterium]
MPKQKFYVVWKGRKTGIFISWTECERQVKGFVGAEFKAFESLREAESALQSKYEAFKGRASTAGKWRESEEPPVTPSICVDASCKGSPGKMEYRGVETESGKEIFRAGPYPDGTNNVGEFLAIVRALAWLSKNKKKLPIYSDSENAIAWVEMGVCRTNLKHTGKNALIFAMIRSAENWLAENELDDEAVLKWETGEWGENPADYGRK